MSRLKDRYPENTDNGSSNPYIDQDIRDEKHRSARRPFGTGAGDMSIGVLLLIVIVVIVIGYIRTH